VRDSEIDALRQQREDGMAALNKAALRLEAIRYWSPADRRRHRGAGPLPHAWERACRFCARKSIRSIRYWLISKW
jgi:hypothetical protein